MSTKAAIVVLVAALFIGGTTVGQTGPAPFPIDPALRSLLEEYEKTVIVERNAGEEQYALWIDRLETAVRNSKDLAAIWAAKGYLQDMYMSLGKCDLAVALADEIAAMEGSPASKLRARYDAVFVRYECGDGPKAEEREQVLRRLVELRQEFEKAPDSFRQSSRLVQCYLTGLTYEAELRRGRGEHREAVEVHLRAAEVAQTAGLWMQAECELASAMELLARVGEIRRAEEILQRLAGMKERKRSMGSYVVLFASSAWPERGPEYWERVEHWVKEATPEERYKGLTWAVLMEELAVRARGRDPSESIRLYNQLLEACEKWPADTDSRYREGIEGMRCNCWLGLAQLYSDSKKPTYEPERAKSYATLYLENCGERNAVTRRAVERILDKLEARADKVAADEAAAASGARP